MPKPTSKDKRPGLLTIGISFCWDFNAKWVDPHTGGKLGGHGLNHCRIPRRKDLDAIETTPDRRLIYLPAAIVCLTKHPLDPICLTSRLAIRREGRSHFIFGEHGRY